MAAVDERTPLGVAAPDDVAAPAGPAGEPRGRGALGVALRALAWVVVRVYPFVLVLGAWHLYATSRDDEFVVPKPSSTWERARAMWDAGALQHDIWITLNRVLGAFALAVVVGVALGAAMGHWASVRRAGRPLVAFLFPTPKIALYPAMLIVFGFGSASKVALGFVEAVFPITLATAAAVSQVPTNLLWTARGLGFGRARTVSRVALPAALPGILTGARIGLVGAVIGVFVGEMVTATDGLGQLLSESSRRLRNADMYVAVAAVALMGLALDRAFLFLRRRWLAWSHEA